MWGRPPRPSAGRLYRTTQSRHRPKSESSSTNLERNIFVGNGSTSGRLVFRHALIEIIAAAR